MRILWVSHSADPGGAELALCEGVVALHARGHEVHVVLGREGPLRARLTSAASVHIEPSRRWAARRLSVRRWLGATAWNALVGAPRIAALARRLAAEVIVTNTLTVPTAALAARRAGIPHAWFIHEFGREDHALRFALGWPLTLRLIGALSCRVLVNSEAVRRHVCRGVPPDRVSLVNYSVEVEPPPAEPAPASRAFKLVLVGKKAPGKGQDDAIRALAIARGRGLDVRLDLVGGSSDVEYERRLRALAGELRVADAVEFAPFEPDPAPRVARADVALLCSRCEAFGRVTVEAMKLGRPVIGTRAGATPELIDEGRTGLLYSAGQPAELAASIERLFRDRALTSSMGVHARSFAEASFNRERYGSELEAALQVCRVEARAAV